MLTPMKPMTPEDLRENIVATYFTLRWGVVVLSIALPVVLYVWNVSSYGQLHETTISAFYGADKWGMRNYFVGTLCVVGSLLFIYKGFSALEKWMLKAAGVAAILVAFRPCSCWVGAGLHDHWHNAFAIAFFACMVVVCEFCAFDTISLLPKAQQGRFTGYYHTIAILLLLSPIGAVIAAYMAAAPKSALFFIEWFGVWVFAAYWVVKSIEFHITSAEKRALRGELKKKEGVGLVPKDAPD